jgi:hypothetical protein
MIKEILESTINEVLLTNKFEIVEFQLGAKPYQLLKQEIENSVSGTSINIYGINNFRGILVEIHPNDNAIMFSLEIKKAP